jgi:N-acetylglucosamine-6-phosphate deacetylase
MKTLYKNCKIISQGLILEGGLLAMDGIIERILQSPREDAAADKVIDLKGNYLAPGFIDTHIHGLDGFGVDGKNPRDLLEMSKILSGQGVIAFAPAIYTDKLDDMLLTLDKLSRAVGSEKGARILGFHIEGPFLSHAKPGAAKPGDIQPVNIKSAQKLYDAARCHIAAMTCAPELDGIAELAKFAKKHNFILQAGHTDATYEEMRKAVKLGIRHSTHLFNAMSVIHHRAPGAPGAILTEYGFTTEIIADNVHLHPAVLKMILKLKGPGNVVLVTDSINPAGKKKGMANGEAVRMEGGVFRRKSDGVIAGSALTMLRGIKNLVKLGYPLAHASMAASDNPAALYDLNCGVMAEGKAAQFAVLDEKLNLKQIVF